MKFILNFTGMLILSAFLASCVGLRTENTAPPASALQPEKIKPSVYIMGQGVIDAERLAFFLLQNNKAADLRSTLILAGLYIEEAARE